MAICFTTKRPQGALKSIEYKDFAAGSAQHEHRKREYQVEHGQREEVEPADLQEPVYSCPDHEAPQEGYQERDQEDLEQKPDELRYGRGAQPAPQEEEGHE